MFRRKRPSTPSVVEDIDSAGKSFFVLVYLEKCFLFVFFQFIKTLLKPEAGKRQTIFLHVY